MACVKRSPGTRGEVVMIRMMPSTNSRHTAKTGRRFEAPSLRSHLRRFGTGVGCPGPACCTVGAAILISSYSWESKSPPKVVARKLFSNHNIRAYQKQAQTHILKAHVLPT